MARKFNFIITADNNPALKAIRAVNRELYKINKPFRDIGRAAGAFARESGFTQLSKAFKGTADAAADVADKIGSILTPLVAVTGFASIAGVAGMAEHWSNLAQQIRMTQYETGMSAREVQSWVQVGKMFGVTTETMTGTLSNFAGAIRDAVYGRNQGLLSVMSNLPGGGIKNLQDRLNDPGGVLKEYMEKIQGLEPSLRKKAIDFAGVGGVQPMYAQGPAALQKALAESSKFIQSDQAVDAGNKFWLIMNKTVTTLENLGNVIAIKINPVLEEMLNNFATWVQNDAPGWLERTAARINGVVDAVGGLNVVLTILGVILFRGVIFGLLNMARIILGMVIGAVGLLGTALLNMMGTTAVTVWLADITAGMATLGAAIIASPIALWVVGLLAVAAAAWGIYKAYQAIHNIMYPAQALGGGTAAGGGSTGAWGGSSVPNPAASVSGLGTAMGNMFATAPSPGIQLGGGTLVSPSADQAASLVGGAIPKSADGASGQVDVNVNFQNMPTGVTPKITSKGNVNPNTNVHYAVPLGFNP